MPTQEEVDAKRDRVAELREQVRTREADRLADIDEKNRQVQMERLEAEEQRLLAQVERDAQPSEPLRPTPTPTTRPADRPLRNTGDGTPSGDGEDSSNE